MELKRALEILEYNKEMLTCDMSISRNPEHQDVSPDYYGKDAEDLYNAIVYVEKYIKNAIPIEWLERKGMILAANKYDFSAGVIRIVIKEWEKENANNN